MRIAIVGAGIAGCCSAWQLARAGHRVTLFEQFGLEHDRGSSHGASRIYRCAYADAFYTRLMLETLPLWRDLERESGERLLERTGLLLAGPPRADWLRRARAGLQAAGVAFDELAPTAAARRAPDIRLQDGEIALLEHDAGWIRADRSRQAALRLAARHGAEVLTGVRVPPRAGPEIGGRTFDAVLYCVGAWTPGMQFASLRVHRQHVAWFTAPSAAALAPVWVDASDDHFFGVPGDPGGHKVGLHRAGARVDPDAGGRDPDPDVVAQIVAAARARLGPDATLRRAQTCLYTIAEDDDFRLGVLDDAPIPSWWISACSGHGFKFGPWLGRLALELLTGRRCAIDLARFASPCR